MKRPAKARSAMRNDRLVIAPVGWRQTGRRHPISTGGRPAFPPQRWRDAVAELLALQAEYVIWLDELPASLQGSATAEALQAVANLDLDDLAAIEPPRGYGRD